jgi:hypothetical protein
MANVAKALREKHPEENLHILVAKRNSGSFTYDGIELGGERVCQEIEDELDKLARNGQEIKKLSIVGYSLGGLVSRYAIGLLYSRGIFDKIEPIVSNTALVSKLMADLCQNFTTFATPHLGVRTPLRGWQNHIWNVLGARTLCMSGRQLFIIDKFRETERSLLSVLADPSSIFIKGLTRFKRRTLYSNIINDRSAVYYTTGLSKNDPFADLSHININYLKGYGNVIIDPANPIAPPEPVAAELPTFYSRLTSTGQSFLVTLALIIFIPIGSVAFLINSGIQTIRSSQRIRLHESGRAGIEVAGYRTPLLITDIREAVEDVYENLNSAQSHEYLPAGGEEEALSPDAPSSPRRERPESPIGSWTVLDNAKEKTKTMVEPTTSLDDIVRPQSRLSKDAPTLALAPAQFAMIQSLDSVGWRKYPVHIHKVRHSHAAIIVRMNRSAFSEGYIVMRHWLDEEFLMD